MICPRLIGSAFQNLSHLWGLRSKSMLWSISPLMNYNDKISKSMSLQSTPKFIFEFTLLRDQFGGCNSVISVQLSEPCIELGTYLRMKVLSLQLYLLQMILNISPNLRGMLSLNLKLGLELLINSDFLQVNSRWWKLEPLLETPPRVPWLN